MLETQFGRRNRDMLGLQRVDGTRHPGLDVAKRAGAGAGVAQDHHRGVLLGPAFADIRARRFLAHRDEAKVAHQLFGIGIALADRRLDADPVGLALAGRCGGRNRERHVHEAPDSD